MTYTIPSHLNCEFFGSFIHSDKKTYELFVVSVIGYSKTS